MKPRQNLSLAIAVMLSCTFAQSESKVQVEEKAIVDEMIENGELSKVDDNTSNYEKFRKKYKKGRKSQQPTTYVEASPLEESQAERLRRARQDAEIGTERKIVEKLEASRLEDEKRRASKLFGGNLNNLSTQEAQQVQQQAPMVQVVNEPTDYQKENDEMKSELIDAVRAELRAKEEVMEEVPEDTYFISGLIGSSEYPDAPDVKSNSSIGFLVGVESANKLVIEGGFIMSSYFLDHHFSSYKELDQYNFTVGVKYSFLPGKVKPTVGALVSYTTRSYATVTDGFGGGFNGFRDETEDTTAFDLGLGAGVDLQVSDGFSVGVDFKYFTNLTSRTSDNFRRFQDDDYKVEDFDYYVFNIMGKIHF